MTEEAVKTTPSMNPKFDEARSLAERMEKAAAEVKIQADRLEQLKAEAILSGTAGIRPDMPAKERTIDDIADEMALETANKYFKKKPIAY